MPDDAAKTKEVAKNDTKKSIKSPVAAEDSANTNVHRVCWLCKHCSQPLGLCIWIWLLIIVASGVTAWRIWVFLTKKKKEKEENGQAA